MPFYILKLKGWAAVVRDTIMFIVIAIIGFLAVPFIFGPNPSRPVLLIFNILLGVIAFCISGCLIEYNRWKHLNKVAVTLSIIISIVIVITFLTPFRYNFNLISLIVFNILISVAAVYIMMALGGSLSFVFAKADGKDLKIIKKN
ncbi:MAG: hypothetical protein ABIK92_07785 [Pseudomonadota bacterium]